MPRAASGPREALNRYRPRGADRAIPAKRRAGLRRSARRLLDQPGQPAGADVPRLAPDPLDEFPDRRNVVNEHRDHAATPGALVHVAVTHDPGIDATALGHAIGNAERNAQRALILSQPFDPVLTKH